MSNQIIVPSLGESVTEATVSKWLKQVGEKVDSDEPLVELETDKVNVEVPSPLAGTLTSIKVKEGDTVEVGALLGEVNESKIASKKAAKVTQTDLKKESYTPPKKSKEKKLKKNEEVLTLDKDVKQENSSQTLVLETLAEEDISEKETEEDISEKEEEKYIPPKTRKNLSPAVRKMVEENNIDISNIEGTGKSGRISKGDLINLMGNIPQPSKRKISHGPEERVKMTRLRATIAKRLKEAQDNAAMLTTFNEVDMHSIMQMKQDYKEDFKKKYSVKLGFMSFFVKASVVALKNFPAVNAEISGDHITYKNYYNISIAIGTDRGLVVPVLKKADELSFADIERNIFLLSEKARLGKITINDLQGGTFTISNGGIYGSMLSTPILNPPQTGILGMHNIVERPIAKDGNIIVRPIMYLALSYDHRIIDGKEAVSFLKTVKECLEEPRRLFLDL
ncbi:2-oxoglutarate dehydrogenase complex dihydrolipoyllysine-residue succinyltransferase [Pelagibacteraceae bacterium]|nr:2-oxoglutarate dehydrogenase complex dihydrolipoyllysine-residue succinyltransferase [Pelagibacteraceae bacterium]